MEDVDSGVLEPVGEECGAGLDLRLSLHQLTETTVVKLVVGVIQILPGKDTNRLL